MKVPWKTILSALVAAAAAVILYGGFLLFVVLFASLAGWPPYAQYALWGWAAVSLPLAVIALAGGQWLIGTDDDIDIFLFFEEFRPQAFGHTTHHAYQEVRVAFPDFRESLYPASYPLFGIFPYRTSIHQNDIRFVLIGCMFEAGGGQNGCYNFAISHIHLATIGFYIKFFYHNFCCFFLSE